MFSSESLKKSFDKLAENAAGLSDRLNIISEDIKNLESMVRELGVAFEVTKKVLPKQSLTHREEGIVGDAELDDCCVDFFADEFLSWRKCDSSGNYRLYYLRHLGCRDAVLLGHFGDEIKLVERPLIETPTPVRIRLSEFLPDLIDEVSKQLN